MNPQNEANYANSVFGRRWAGVFSDEVHSCRNLNMNGKAVWILNRKSQAVVLASATMLYTSLQVRCITVIQIGLPAYNPSGLEEYWVYCKSPSLCWCKGSGNMAGI